MPRNPKKLSLFWQELKRRKVVRVSIGDLASSYVLLELTSIIAGPWGLPGWTINFVSVLLIIGFFVTVIISWIFDVTPEGIKKTESAKAARGKSGNLPVKRKLMVSDAIIGVLLVAVIVLAYPRIFKKDKFENIRDNDGKISIAVMPFENLTGDTAMNYFQRGLSSIISNGLGSSSELTVCDDQTMFEILSSINPVSTAGFSPSLSKEVAKRVKARTYISGSFQGRS